MGEGSNIAITNASIGSEETESTVGMEYAIVDTGVWINTDIMDSSRQDSDERLQREKTSRQHRSMSNSKILPEEALVEDLRLEHVSLSHDSGRSYHLTLLHRTSRPWAGNKCHILELPIELIEALCREFIDTTTATCLGLTCHAFFEITEHLYPFQVNLHMRTRGQNRKCLGHLLTDWMAPKYSFDHSWGKFLLKRHWRGDESEVEKKWREKEGWRRIKLLKDRMGAVVAYESQTRGF